MAFIEREIKKVVKERAFTCDFTEKSSLGTILFCEVEVINRDVLPKDWSVVKISHSTGEPYKATDKIIHFCPKHGAKVESRLARILEP